MDEMEAGARIGVMSVRLRSQMSALWPDLNFEILHGGIDHAMASHMENSEIDGLVLPAAVTEHLGIQGIVAEIYTPDFMLPSPGQGILVIVGHESDQNAVELLQDLHSATTALELATEKAFCCRMISGQDLPLGVLAKVVGSQIVITGATGAGTQRTRQTDTAGLVTVITTVVDVVRAVQPCEKLQQERSLIRRTSAAIKEVLLWR